jgi:plasmid stability protein
MPSLQIRNLPEHVYEALVVRAQAEHRSLSQQAAIELKHMPEVSARERRLVAVRNLREQIRGGKGNGELVPPEELVREDRDR